MRQIPSTLSIANFLADPNYVQQIFITSEPFFAKQAGAEVRTFLISSSGYDPYRVQFTTRDFAAQHPDVVAKFVRASIRGWQEYLRNPGPTNAYLLKLNPALNPAQEAYTAQALARRRVHHRGRPQRRADRTHDGCALADQLRTTEVAGDSAWAD